MRSIQAQQSHFEGERQGLPIEPSHATQLAINGEVAEIVQNPGAPGFSERALQVLSTIRMLDGGRKTHTLDVPG